MTKFGDWIRSRRKDLNLLQSDVAKRAKVSTSYISTLERGQKHSITGANLTPERDKVIRIAKAVQGNVDEALALCGYTPAETITLDVSPDLRVALLKRDVRPEDRGRFELALKMAYETAKAIIEREREQIENNK